MSSRPSASGALGAFSLPSFRYQFSADLLTAWAIEMEVLLLAWYVLIETGSAFLVAALGALRFTGTLLSPILGAYADHLPRKPLLVSMRVAFALLAAVVAVLGVLEALAPWHALVVAALAGLLRSPDMMLRQSLIADTVPRPLLMSAVSLQRTTLDSARIVGPMLAAVLMAAFGLGTAYAVVATCYVGCAALSLGIGPVPRAGVATRPRPVVDLLEGARYIRGSPAIVALLTLAFIVNLTALSITGGMLPVVAKEAYGLDETGLGAMQATHAAGALLGSLLIAWLIRTAEPTRTMLGANLVWHVLLIGFALTESPWLGTGCLALIGLASSYVMVPLSSCLIVAVAEPFRARVMGVRQLAVFGLPVGLLGCGLLAERIGIGTTLAAYGALGLVLGIGLWSRWPRPGG